MNTANTLFFHCFFLHCKIPYCKWLHPIQIPSPTNPMASLPPFNLPSQEFQIEITWLIQRNLLDLPRPHFNLVKYNKLSTTPPYHPPYYPSSFTHKYYSSPLTCSFELNHCRFPHPSNAIFGAHDHIYAT